MNEQQKIDINISDEVAQGVYSNLVIITHSNAEFVLDFVAMMPGVPKANVRSRVVMTPQNAKRFLGALNENIKKFEENNGVIVETMMEAPPLIGPGGAQA